MKKEEEEEEEEGEGEEKETRSFLADKETKDDIYVDV